MLLLVELAIVGAGVCTGITYYREKRWNTPEELLEKYMDCIPQKEYEKMYDMINEEASGNISRDDFDNEAFFLKGKKGYEIIWEDSLIFPQLGPEDKVRIAFDEAERGGILDRNGNVLAGKGIASSVGIVPGKLQNKKQTVGQIAGLLKMKPEEIEKKLSQKWVKEDSFVPVKTIPKVRETELLSVNPDEEILKEAERQKMLLEIPGVMIADKEKGNR